MHIIKATVLLALTGITWANDVKITHEGEIKKRAFVLECDSRFPIPKPPPGRTDRRVTYFKTLTSLCGEYPSGLGYHCTQRGLLRVTWPFSSLYNGPPNSNYLQKACQQHCYCPDIAPQISNQSTSQLMQQCVSNNDGDATSVQDVKPAVCTGTNYRDPDSEEYIICSRIYGRPKKINCLEALASMGHSLGQLTDDREFIGQGAPPTYANHTQERTPLFFAHKACNISIDTRHHARDVRSDLEKGNYLWGRAHAIYKKCVEPHGMGGWAVAGERTRDLGVYVFHPKSRFAALTNHRHSCAADDDGDVLHGGCPLPSASASSRFHQPSKVAAPRALTRHAG